MDDFFRSAELTLYLAAPVEGAGAALHHGDFLRPVPPSTAHQVAAVHADRGVVTLATVRTLDAEPGIALAEAGRRFQIDQILRARWFVFRVVRFQLEVIPARTEGENWETKQVRY